MPPSLLIQLIIFYSILYLSKSQNQFYQIKPHDISTLIGSNITIPCVVTPPHGDVQWTKDGLALGYDRQLPAFPTWSIIGDENRGEFNFFIQSLKLDDEGMFACEVSPYNDAPALKQVAQIRVLVRPEHVQINDQVNSTEAAKVTIRFDEPIHQINCRVNGARPAAHIKWINESGEEFPATSRIFIQDRLFSTVSTLTVFPSLLLDKKRFTCDVRHETLTNNATILQTQFEIKIMSPPSIPSIHGYPSTFRLINGSDLTLSCRSQGGYPLSQLLWYKLENKNKPLILFDNSSLIFHRENITESNISMIIKPSDNNITVSCHVVNDYLYSLRQTLQTNITLQVAFGPSSVQIQDNNLNITTLVEGTSRQFVCRTSSSNPPATVVWKLDGQTIFADIKPLQEQGEFSGTTTQLVKTFGLNRQLRDYHTKILSCEAQNPETGHLIIDSTQLNIIYDATSIEMHSLTGNKIIKVGDTITAECTLTGGNPLGKKDWYKGNESLHSDYVIETSEKSTLSRVRFVALSSDNNLPLICKGQVEKFPQRIASLILNITFLPDEIMIIENALFSNLSMNNNDYREFECRTSISNPQAQLIIIRQSTDGQNHSDIQYKSSSSYINGINSIKFILPRIDLSLHGNSLTCQAILDIDTEILTKQVTYVLNVNHEPYFNDFDPFNERRENQSFKIELQANAYPMPIVYTWFHPSGRQVLNDQAEFSMINLQKSDSGVYRCIAANAVGKTEVNFTLNILYAPVITRTQGYSLLEPIMPGSSAILLCVIDANPVELNNVRWFKGDQDISLIMNKTQWERRFEGKEVSLIGKSVQKEDAGQYICEIDNHLGISRATLPLVIQYAPEIDRIDPSRSKAATDSDRLLTAELHCYVSAIPKPTVIWMKDNQIIPSSSKHRSILNERVTSTSFSPNLLFDAILYVANVTKSDHGVYQCKMENTLGVDKTEIILTGLTVPDRPSQLHMTNTSHSSLLINWIPGFDGGAHQTFQIRYRLSKDDRYSYENVPFGAQSYDLKNLRLRSEYHINIRSNNSYYISEWTDEIVGLTSDYSPSSPYQPTKLSPTQFSFTVTIIIVALLILLINIILISFFIIKRRRLHFNSDKSSTTGTNETEANTVDIFQPIPSNFLFDNPLSSTTKNAYSSNTYKKYDDEDPKRPFVSAYTSATLTRLLLNSDNISTYATVKKDRCWPYDTVRLNHYSPSNINNDLVTYRSFKDDMGSSSVRHECIKVDLV